jgi:LacI family transcriptional regulator
LAFPNRSANLHVVLRGIVDYARKRANWIFTNGGASFDFPLANLCNWDGDGIIAHMTSEADVDAARRLNIPIVTFGGALRKPGVPRVALAQAAIGELAAEHLLMHGYSNFAFCGIQSLYYSIDRLEAFSRVLRTRGFSPLVHLSHTALGGQPRSWDEQLVEMSQWVSSLPKPIGIFAANDQRARMIADASHIAKANIPRELGIVGVDNNEIDCEFGSPTLTSVAFDWHSLGYETAALLGHLMDGKGAPAREKVIAPIGLIARESTNAVITSDPQVAKAIDFVNRQPSRSFGVEALVAAAGGSRRHLEVAFRNSLGCSPAEFLARIRTERAKSLLQRDGFTLTMIAEQCGFTDIRQFRRTFRRMTGKLPAQYRESMQTIIQR